MPSVIYCCCEDCTIASDDYNRSDSGTVTGWTEVSGTWAIDTNQLRGNGGLIVNDTLHPDGNTGKSRVRVTMTPDYNVASTVTGRIITAYADASNYLFAQVTFVEDSCVTVRLGIREAASETWLTDALSVATSDGDSLTGYLCWQPPTGSGSDYVEGQLGFNINAAALSCLSAETAGIEGDQWGLSVSAGDVLFDDWKAEYHYDSAEHPTCPQCSCAGVCTIFTDDFEDRSTLGCWTQVAATATVGSDVLTVESTGLVVANATPQTDEDAIRVVQTIRTDDSSATLRIIVGYTDSSNYLFAEIAKSGSTVTARLGKRVSASDSYLTDAEEVTADLTTATEVQVCWRPGEHLDETEAVQYRSPTNTTQGGGLESWTIADPAVPEADYTFSEDDESTNPLLFGQFFFSLPPGSTPTGIEISANVTYPVAQSTVIDDAVFYFYGNDSEESSDDLASDTQVPDEGTESNPGNISWGDSASLSGGDPTWDEINDLTFSLSMVFTTTTTPLSNAPLTVADVLVAVYFTTPPRAPGRLQVSVGGECVTEYNITHETGSQVGYQAASGDWEIDDFQLGYERSGDRPSCPTCECDNAEIAGCPQCDPAYSQYAVTIGGITYILEFVGAFGDFCLWGYDEGCDDGEVFAMWLYFYPAAINDFGGIVLHTSDSVNGDHGYYTNSDTPDCEGTTNLSEVVFDWGFGALTNASKCGVDLPGTATLEPA